MLFNQGFEFKIFVLMIIIVKLKLIKFHNYDNKMLSITNKEFDNKISIFFFQKIFEIKTSILTHKVCYF